MKSTHSIIDAIATPTPKDILHKVTVSSIPSAPQEQHSLIAKIIGFVSSLLLRIVGFATISIPVFFYRVLTWSFTLHLNFTSLLIILAIIATIAYWVVRYRFLTKYSRLKPINKPPKVASSFDLHPDTGDDDDFSGFPSKPGGYKNYPDEFLSAFLSSIKIFGYLEQPVFHELARHLQTKKLLAGDTLFKNPEQEKSFYIVVDGHVQMFVKPENADDDNNSDTEEEDESDLEASRSSSQANSFNGSSDEYDFMDNGINKSTPRRDKFKNYTLINEVGAGGTLSSLFTILSIFRESFNRSEAKQKIRNRSLSNNRTILNRIAPMGNTTEPAVATTNVVPVDMSREASADEWRQVFPGLKDSSLNALSASSSRPDSENSLANGTIAAAKADKIAQSPPAVESMIVAEDDYFSNELGPRDTSISDSLSNISSVPVHQKLSVSASMPLKNNSLRMMVTDNTGRPSLRSQSSFSRRSYRSVHPNIIARATVDTTLAVIPEEAFHKLTQKFPKAAAHIVQVIVTRFQRVTLMTSHRYLGLTNELLRLEKMVNESASLLTLPANFFVPGGMDRLRRKFNQEDEESSENGRRSEGDTIGPSELSRSESSGIIRAINIIDMPGTPSINLNHSGHNSSINLAAKNNSKGGSNNTAGSPNLIQHHKDLNRNGEYSMEDDEHLRNSVMRCMADALGIKIPQNYRSSTMTPSQQEHISRTAAAVTSQAAPRNSRRILQYPMDLFSHANVGSTTSLSLDDDEESYVDDDTDARSTSSSVQSGTTISDIFSTGHGHGSRNTQPISPDDIQILYFPQGAVLVKEGAHNNGLFFVIDGLLEASMTPAKHENGLCNIPSSNRTKTTKTKDSNIKKIKKSKQNIQQRQKFHDHDSSFKISPSTSTENLPQLAEEAQQEANRPTENDKRAKIIASEAPAGRTADNQKNEGGEAKAKKPLYLVKPGGLAGYLDALTGFPSFMEIRAKTDTYVGYISKKKLDRIIDKNPNVMLKLANQLVGHVSQLILHIDIALEWMQVNAGQIICREGDPSDAIYMVLHGRLRTIHETKEGVIEILGEFGHGDSVGELEVLTGASISSTLHAIRDTELARMPKTLFNALAIKYPQITLQISRMVAFRSLERAMNPTATNIKSKSSSFRQIKTSDDASEAISSITSSGNGNSSCNYPELYGRNNVNLKTVGIIPVNSSVPISDFAENLKSELIHSVGATCALLNSATVATIMGKYAFARLGKLKMASWLAEQEEKYRIVLYLADSGVTSQWTRTCIRQADCILLVGLADGDNSVGEYERFLINMKTTARKELVLLHHERHCASGTTQNWLKNRLWIQAHHHICMPLKQHTKLSVSERFRPPWLVEHGRKMTANSIQVLNKVKDQINEYYSVVPTFGRLLDINKSTTNSINTFSSPSRNDFARLARRLCGKSVALVLGGGGARGIGHVAVIQAMEEAGIPIDIIGGTSIGSFVGGLYARHMDLVSTIARSKMFAGRVSSIWRQLMDLTYPVTAWFTGHQMNRAVWKCLGDSQIEDFWLPYYAVTTNITFSRMEVHTTGYAWRYIRASMSLSGYMPPICDNGNLLVDGGYMDNLPISVAKNMGADIIIAVDVASDDDTSPVYYGDSVSGWWALLHGLNPFRTYNIPSIADIQSRLAYVSSVATLEEAKVIDGALYLKLPVQEWGTLQFGKYNEIFQRGYDVGREVIGRWKKYAHGRITEADSDAKVGGKEVKGSRGRRNSI
ncbi:hypothetical protein BDF20DRAFT_839761 [Mycotypha africana]|uniref:uncharacterized protein n=1 Tax=Mycotypha africana TaxID=64632 RepID=UPI0023002CAD|nr:uncharacterized protein BDF20DRAFT_839761 [Mycotypha africana]KAI8967925.1 hypothetical protein BDF20DRAFT_839761 [Mycotypha africana]